MVNINAGPYPHRRINRAILTEETAAVVRLSLDGLSIRQIAARSPAELGRALSKSTVHRRVADALRLPDATADRRCPACGRMSCTGARHA